MATTTTTLAPERELAELADEILALLDGALAANDRWRARFTERTT